MYRPSRKKYKRKLILYVLALLFIFASSALASTPTITEFSPSQGAIITESKPPIYIKVTDADKIATTGYYIKVNGAVINSTIDFPIGHIAYDSCGGEYWAVDDYTQAIISATDPSLVDGPQTIEVKVLDSLNNAVTYSWGINVAAKPTFSEQTPALGSYAKGNTQISVKVSDNTVVDPLSIILKVDGVEVAHTYTSATGIISYTSPITLSDGIHNLYVSAKDMAGNLGETSWSYSVLNVGPQLTYSDADKTLSTPTPNFSVWAVSNVKLNNVTAKLLVDGQGIPTNFTYKGHIYYDYDWEEWVVDSYNEGSITGVPATLRDGPHTLTATLADILGNNSTKQWSFNINSPPKFSNPIPADKANVTNATGFQVKVTENDAIVSSSLVVKLDNVEVPVNYNPQTGVITYTAVPLMTDGLHNVNISVADTTGNVSTYSWAFTVQTVGPTLTFNGAGAKLETYKPNLAVTAKSNIKISSTDYQISIDGKPIGTTFTYKGHIEYGYDEEYWFIDSYNEATLTCNSIELTDGAHTLTATVKDILGNTTTKSWNFTIAQKPDITNLTPANDSIVNTYAPVIKAVISDLNGPAININSVKMFIDNIEVIPEVSLVNGLVTASYTPKQLKDDAYHIINVSAADTAGNSNESTWRFYVNTKGDMTSNSKACGTCHTLNQYNKYVHTQSPLYGGTCGHCHSGFDAKFCGYCHNGDPWAISEGGATPDPSYQSDLNCTYCHTNTPKIFGNRSANEYVQRQVNISAGPAELTSWNILVHDFMPSHYISKGTCNDCHSTYLTREHNKTNKLGQQMDCATCHNSTNPLVKQAITNKNRDCSACHDKADHDQYHVSNLPASCQGCHSPILNQAHLNLSTIDSQEKSCNLCHASADLDVRLAIATKNLTCSSCHEQFHGQPLGIISPADIPISSDLKWTPPIDSNYLIGDVTIPIGYGTSKYMLSKWRSDILPEAIFDYYTEKLAVNGWVLKTKNVNTDNTFTMEYSKAQRIVLIKCLVNSGLGYRVEIWYK